ncbi:hypothetical protein ACH40F_12370 [Streptomyces sp. NPDC020794]
MCSRDGAMHHPRTVTPAQFTVVNGIGYDAWADKLLSATPRAAAPI